MIPYNITRYKSYMNIFLYSINRNLLEVQNSILSIVVGIWFFIYPYDYLAYPGTFRYLAILYAYIWTIIYLSFGTIHLLCLFTRFKRLRKDIMLIKSGL